MQKNIRWSLVVLSALAVGLSGEARASSIVDDFSLSGNPNGVWSYEVNGALLSTALDPCVVSGLLCWTNNGSTPNSAFIAKNTTGSTIVVSSTVNIHPDHLNLDPQSISNVSVLFTAATAGTYSILGDFLGDDAGEQAHAVSITLNGVSIYSNTISTFNQSDPFNLTRALSVGDQLNFISVTGASFSNLGTGLAATVTPVSATPEPATAGLMGFALVAFWQAARRTKRSR